MATALSLRSKLEDELECSLCLERLKDPRVFPQCQHTFCYGCIEVLCQGKSTISCPECRAEVEIGTPPDLSRFKRNTRINNILECVSNDSILESRKHEIDEHTTTAVCSNATDPDESGAEISTSACEQRLPKHDAKSSSTNPRQMTNTDLDIDSMVEVQGRNQEPKYGVIRWIGYIPGNDKKVAGLELEEEANACSDGTFLGKRYFTCSPRRGFFAYLQDCRSDSRSHINSKQNTASKALTNAVSRDNSSSVPQTSEGIVKMERKFLKQSQDGNQKDFSQYKRSLNTFYILMKDRMARKEVYKNYRLSSRGNKGLLKGEILIRNATTCVDSKNGTLRLHPYDRPSYFSDCPLGEVKPLEEEEANLLLSVKSNDERYKLFIDNTLSIGKKMTIGTNVYVKVRTMGGGIQEVRGIIRYKGPLPGEHGTMFGVELLEGRGRGTTDGLFKTQRFFQCDTECGMFVSLEKLRLCDESILTRVKNRILESFTNLLSPGEQPHEDESLVNQDHYMGHKLEDIAWVYTCKNDEKPHGGVLKYIGRVPGHTGIFAGIAMGKPVGQGDGEYYGEQLFTCPWNHAYFTLIENVISEKKYHEVYEQPEKAKVASGSSTPSFVPQTSKDISKMESKFPQRSKDQVIKEQEEILQQIKQQTEQKKKMSKKKGLF